jgi:hypothetical protein
LRLSPLILLFAVCVGIPERARAQTQAPADEYQVKAAFLFHFAQLVDWPPDALSDNNSLFLCAFGDDPFRGELESTVEGRLIGTRALRIRHLKSAQDAQSCHILFVGKGEGKDIASLLAAIQNTPVLTVGETDDFLQQGGVIRFCLQNNKVRFEINLEAAFRARLKISSRLLLLTKTVVGSRGEK